MKIEQDIKLDFDDVLIKPKRSTLRSRNDVDLEREYKFLHSNLIWKGVPIMASNMDTVGTYEMANELIKYKLITVFHKFYNVTDYSWFKFNKSYMIPSIGANEKDFEKFCKIYDVVKPDFVCLDVANGYSQYLIDYVRKIRESYDKITLIVGNVVSGNMTEELIMNGADIIKVGLGNGRACSTRIKTGVGCPQLSAVIECADAAHGLNAHIISDGGCKTPGDVAKAFGAGADFVMLGGMLAGHNESGGELITEKILTNKVINGIQEIEEHKYKIFYGMSSDTSQKKYYGQINNYRTSEGRTVKIPYKGKVENTLLDILGGIRSTCTYVGANKLKNLSKCCTFIRVNRQYNNLYERFDV